MANIDSAALIEWSKKFPSDITGFLGLLREKGLRHFQRPLVAAVLPLVVIYYFVYRGSAEQLDHLRAENEALAEVVKYAPKYRDLQDRLHAFYDSLPEDQDRPRWLTDNVREALRAEKISPDTFSTATEDTRGGFAVVSLSMKVHLKFKQLAVWIARLERLRYPIHVTKFSLHKDTTDVSMNDVDVTVSAIFTKGAK